jgi:hypothetical protein
MTVAMNDDAATRELSIEELDSVAGGELSLRGFLGAMAGGGVAGLAIGAAAGGIGAGPGAAGGAAAGGISYLVRGLIDLF